MTAISVLHRGCIHAYALAPHAAECAPDIALLLQEAGLKSKRHVKLMLQSMRKAGAVQTKPVGKGQNYVYALRSLSKKAQASDTAVDGQTSTVAA